MSTWGIVVAAGSGSRFGGPKQFELLGGKRVIDWSLDYLQAALDGVVVVVAAEEVEQWRAALDGNESVDAVVEGGATRSASVRSGLAALPDDAVIVVVHDAARPLATEEMLKGVLDAIDQGADAAVPGVPVNDTIKRVDHSSPTMRVVETVDRDQLVAVQTPQAFRLAALRQAHTSGTEATDDAGLIEQQGGIVVVVPGDHRNIKITVATDLLVARVLANT